MYTVPQPAAALPARPLIILVLAVGGWCGVVATVAVVTILLITSAAIFIPVLGSFHNMESCRLSVRPEKTSILPSNVRGDSRKSLQGTLTDTIQRLEAIYQTAGYSEEEIEEYLSEFGLRLQSTCDAELETEGRILAMGAAQIDAAEAEIRQLLSDLGKNESPLHHYKVKNNYNSRLNALKHQCEVLQEERKLRLAMVDAKRSEVLELASLLGETAAVIDTTSISDETMNTLEELKSSYTALMSRRQEKVRALCRECQKLYEELAVLVEGFETLPDHTQCSGLDQRILQFIGEDEEGRSSVFTLHLVELEALDARRQALVSEKARRREALAAMGESIARLWNHLKVVKSEREAFQASFSMTLSMRTLRTGQAELQRLKLLRSESLVAVVYEVRGRIEELWDEALTGPECRRKAFPLFFEPVEDLDDEAVSLVPIPRLRP